MLLPYEARSQIREAEDAAQLLMDMGMLQREELHVILVASGKHLVAIWAAELYKEAIKRNTPALILVHNHQKVFN